MSNWEQTGTQPSTTNRSDTGDVQAQASQLADEAREAARQATNTAEQRTSEATDQARDAVGQAKQAAGQAVNEAQQQAGQAVNAASQQAEQMLGNVQQQATALVSEQVTRVSSTFGGVAQALRASSEELRNQERGDFAHYTDQIADQLDGISTHLQNGDVGTLLRDVEHFARREPALFVGGALTAGLLLARFLKSSAEPSNDTRGRYPGANRYPIQEYERRPAGSSQWGGSAYGATRSYGSESSRYPEQGRYGVGDTGYDNAQSSQGETERPSWRPDQGV